MSRFPRAASSSSAQPILPIRAIPDYFTGFKLDAEGEFIGLYLPDGSVLDSLSFGQQHSGTSFGRFPDGSASWSVMIDPTPGGPNEKSASIRLATPEGVYAGAVEVVIETNGTDPIRYTLDGREPRPTDPVYAGPIRLTRSTVIRARVFVGSVAISQEISGTYIIGETPGLPVLSVMTDPKNLWDPSIGIYANPEARGDAWEKPARIELIENGTVRFFVPAGIRIHGNSSRKFDKKSFHLFFREEYGISKLDCPIFGADFPDSFKRLVLYAGSKDQPTKYSNYTLIADVLTHDLFLQIGGAASAFKPVALYLDGQYWGLYWIREAIDKYYVETHFGPTDIDMLNDDFEPQYMEVSEGDANYWQETFNWIETHNLARPENFETVSQKYLDLDNFTDYYLVNIFAGNWAFPHSEVDRFRDRIGEDPRWRWIMWDTELAWKWGPDIQFSGVRHARHGHRTSAAPLEHGDHPQTARKQRLQKPVHQPIRRSHQHHALFGERHRPKSTVWSPGSGRKCPVKSGAGYRRIRPLNMTINGNRTSITFASSPRDDPISSARKSFEKFRLGGTWNLTLQSPIGHGSVRLNSLKVNAFPFQGVYFLGVPVSLRAEPIPGETFYGWSEPRFAANRGHTHFAEFGSEHSGHISYDTQTRFHRDQRNQLSRFRYLRYQGLGGII